MMMPDLLLAAAPTADAIFKSMGQPAEGGDVNPATVLMVIAGAVGLIVLASLFKQRTDARAARPAAVSSPGKLMRQLAKEAGLRRKEVRELKRLAEIAKVEHPITLLLCPSLMQAAIAKRKEGVGH